MTKSVTTGLPASPADVRELFGDHGELLHQAMVARALGSSFVAAVLEAAHRHIGRAPRTAALLADWPGDRAAAALAMRLNGALHALARRRASAALEGLYRRHHDDFDRAIGATLADEDAFIARWMRHPPQTNEVGRSAALLSALMTAQRRFGLPFDLLELGSSGGLNLNLLRYSYDLGGLAAGQQGSHVRIAPVWRGPAPAAAPVTLVAARGADLHPLDPADAATRERLLSFVWADQTERSDRLEQALILARSHPPRVDRANARDWLAERLAADQPAGTCRAVMHSMVLQYLSAAERRDVEAVIERAGARAESARPLVRIGFEWNAARSEVRLLLTCWPIGETLQLARCHPYGDWIDWYGDGRPA